MTLVYTDTHSLTDSPREDWNW